MEKGGGNMNQREIIQMLLLREETGMKELLTHYGPLLRYIIAPILSNPHDREDCLSETALRVWQKIDQFDVERGSWTAWLTAIARNTALNHAAKLTRSAGEELTEHIPSPEPTPEEAVLLRERRAAVADAIGKLAPDERLLFYRKYYYLQSTAQIAAELGTTERSIEGKLYRLRKKLRALLGGEGYD